MGDARLGPSWRLYLLGLGFSSAMGVADAVDNCIVNDR